MPIIALKDIKFDDNESGVVPLSSIKFDDEMSGKVVPLESVRFDDDIQESAGESIEPENPNWRATKDVIRFAPRTATDIGKSVISGMTLGLSDKVGEGADWLSEKLTGVKLPEKEDEYIPPNKYITGAAEFVGAAAPISVAGKFVATPVKTVVEGISKSKYIKPLANLIGWGTAGSAYDTAHKLINEGELPTAKELGQSGAMWAGLEGAFSSVGWTGRLALGVNRFAKAAGITRKEALNVILGEAKQTNAPISRFASDWSKYQVALKKMEGTKAGEQLKSRINSAAEEFVGNVDMLANKVGKQGTYPDLVDKIVQTDREIVASKKGSPLIRPQERAGGTPIPKPLDTGVKEGTEDVRPVWQVKQEAEALAREKWLDIEIQKRKILADLEAKGKPLPKALVADVARTQERFNTAWRERELLGKVKAEEGFQSEDVIADKEAPLRPDQRSAVQTRTLKPIEETNVPTNELTPEQVRVRDLERRLEDSKTSTGKQRALQAWLEKNRPLAQKSPLETPSPVSSAGALDASGQVSRTAPERQATQVGKAVEPKAEAKEPLTLEEFKAKNKEGRFTIVGSRLRGDNKPTSDTDVVTQLTPEENARYLATPEGEYPRIPQDIKDRVYSNTGDVFIEDGGKLYHVGKHPEAEGEVWIEGLSEKKQNILTGTKKGEKPAKEFTSLDDTIKEAYEKQAKAESPKPAEPTAGKTASDYNGRIFATLTDKDSGETFSLSLRPDNSEIGTFSVVTKNKEGRSSSVRMHYKAGTPIEQVVKDYQEYLDIDDRARFNVSGIAEKPKRVKPPQKTLSPDEAELKRLEGIKYKTAGVEKSIRILKAKIAVDPSKWNVGDGVGWRIGEGKGSQINRGFRIIDINPETKTATIRSVADTGLTVSGGNFDKIADEQVHLSDLIKDNKYNSTKSIPSTAGKPKLSNAPTTPISVQEGKGKAEIPPEERIRLANEKQERLRREWIDTERKKDPTFAPDIESRKELLTSEQLKEVTEYEDLLYKATALDRENNYKPYKLTKKETSRLKELRSKYNHIYNAKLAKPEQPTTEGKAETGAVKVETPRKVSEIWQDMKTVLGDTERGSVSNKPLNENQIAAIERITEDARRAKKDIETYMREHGAKPEAIAKVLANRELYYKQKEPAINQAQAVSAKQSPVITEPKQIIDKFSKTPSTILKDTRQGLDNAFGVVSTRLGNIAPELKDTVKKHAAEIDIHTWTDLNKAKSFIEKGTKLSTEDQFKLTTLLRNGQYDKNARTQMLAFMKEKDMLKDYAAVENVIADTLRRGLDSGMTINEIKNFFPSHVKNYAGIRTVLGKDNIGKIDEAFEKEASKKGITVDELGDESKGAIIDSMMRGWSKNKIYLFDPYEIKSGIGKSRTLTTLTPELMQHYYPFHESLVKYIGSMNTAIANNNLFKKSRKIGKAIQMEGIDLPIGKPELSDSIGDIILDLKDKGKFSKDPNRAMEQEAELRHVLTSYMMPKSQGKYVTGLKNLTYNALLGNPMTALTQFQDIFVTMSRHGVRNTLQGLGRMMTKNAEKLADIGIDNFKADLERNTNMGKATKLNMASLTLTDMFGKGLNMNANMVKTQRALKNPKYKPEIEAEIDRLFGEDAAQVKQDLLNNKKTLATNTFVHYNLAKHHPISKAEVPTGYLNGDKTRLLYMLHTYQIKQLDIFRNDVINQIKAGNIAKGAYNMASLTAWLLAGGVTVNAARDFIFKGDVKALDEYLTDSAWQITLVNRYLVDKGFREGVGSFLWNSVAPGTVSIANDISKDLLLEDKKDKGLRSTKYIPLIGRPYYDRWGRGSVVRKEYEDKEKPKSKYGNLKGIQ